MTATEKKHAAQDLIMQQISIIGYGSDYEDYVKQVGNEDEAVEVLCKQMNRVAKLLGYEKAWFS